MKRSFLLFVLLCVSISVFAQTTTFGVKAGFNFANLIYSGVPKGSSESTQSRIGFQAGGLVDFEFGNVLVQPGVLFSTKGGESTGGPGVEKLVFNYIDVPLNVLYKLPSGDNAIYVGAGVYYDYGLSAKATFDAQTEGKPDTHTRANVFFGSAADQFKNPDFGLNFLAFYQFKWGMMINAGYSLGMTNLSNVVTASKIQNQVISISAGYFFK